MSPVFRHGLLRLYLLKLLDEAPRHGYDVIRLLQDRFLGVYSPSPGTIYPRLARLEEEGLVTHEVVDGKKVYRITDAGRAELNSRLDDLADLEDQLTASVRDIASQISRDVRETVRSLRDELTWAVREAGRPGREGADSASAQRGEPRRATDDTEPVGGRKHAEGKQPDDREQGDRAHTCAGDGGGDDHQGGRGRADDAERARTHPAGDWRIRLDWREWASWAERPDWREWADWAKRQDWADWPRSREWREQVRVSKQEWKDQAQMWRDQARASKQDASKQEWHDWARATGPDQPGVRPRDRRGPDRDLVADLEHLAAAFATQVRGFARHAETVGDEAVIRLGKILGDTMSRISAEVFGAGGPRGPEPEPDGPDERPEPQPAAEAPAEPDSPRAQQQPEPDSPRAQQQPEPDSPRAQQQPEPGSPNPPE